MSEVVGACYGSRFVKLGGDEGGWELWDGLVLKRWSPKPEEEDNGKSEENVAR